MSDLRPGPDSESYDPASPDAMFARILSELSHINGQLSDMKATRAALAERVEVLERERWYQRGIVAAIATGIAAAWQYLKHD